MNSVAINLVIVKTRIEFRH